MSKVLNGRQQESFFRSFWDKERNQFGFGPDISNEFKDGLSCWSFGSNHIDFFIADKGVA